MKMGIHNYFIILAIGLIICGCNSHNNGPPGDIVMITPYVDEAEILRVGAFSANNNIDLDFIVNQKYIPFRAVSSGKVTMVRLWQNDQETWQVNVGIKYNSTYSYEYIFGNFSQEGGETQLKHICVREGEMISQGDIIGHSYLGSEPERGIVFHFKKNDESICPGPYFTEEARNSILELIHRYEPDLDICNE
jgi:hypothetical protein